MKYQVHSLKLCKFYKQHQKSSGKQQIMQNKVK